MAPPSRYRYQIWTVWCEPATCHKGKQNFRIWHTHTSSPRTANNQHHSHLAGPGDPTSDTNIDASFCLHTHWLPTALSRPESAPCLCARKLPHSRACHVNTTASQNSLQGAYIQLSSSGALLESFQGCLANSYQLLPLLYSR